MAPKPGPKLEAVSARLKGVLIHPNRSGMLVGVRFSADGQRIVAGDYPGGVVVVWVVATGKQLRAIETGYGYRGSYQYFLLTPDWQTCFAPREKSKVERVEQNGKRLLRWQFAGGVRAWSVGSGQLQKTFQDRPARGIVGMQLSPDGTKFVTLDELPGTYEGSPKRAVSLWDVRTGRHRTLPYRLQFYGRFSPDGAALAIGAVDENGNVQALKLFDSGTGREKLSIPIPDKNVRAYVSAFSPDDRLMAGEYTIYERPRSWDKYRSWFKCWDTSTGREVMSFATDGRVGLNCCFAPDGRTLAASQWGGQKIQLFLFRVRDKQLVKTLLVGEQAKGTRLITSGPVFSPDGKWLALTTQALPDNRGSGDPDVRDLPQPRIHLIDVGAGAIRETLIAPQGLTHAACCFSPDGRTLATGGNGRVLLWVMTKLPIGRSGER